MIKLAFALMVILISSKSFGFDQWSQPLKTILGPVELSPGQYLVSMNWDACLPAVGEADLFKFFEGGKGYRLRILPKSIQGNGPIPPPVCFQGKSKAYQLLVLDKSTVVEVVFPDRAWPVAEASIRELDLELE
ncbi:MAG: hypothetical protein KDD25_06750 [Bdellovibrionales bacterium]|nr:hypothetical protein [Bdellovibrionales bacterium]